jgi:hypothetical protein
LALVSHLLRALEEFGHIGVDFVSVSKSIDTSTPIGKMVFTVVAAVAELERKFHPGALFGTTPSCSRQADERKTNVARRYL